MTTRVAFVSVIKGIADETILFKILKKVPGGYGNLKPNDSIVGHFAKLLVGSNSFPPERSQIRCFAIFPHTNLNVIRLDLIRGYAWCYWYYLPVSLKTLAAYRYIATWMSAKEVKDRVSMDDKDGFNGDWT